MQNAAAAVVAMAMVLTLVEGALSGRPAPAWRLLGLPPGLQVCVCASITACLHYFSLHAVPPV